MAEFFSASFGLNDSGALDGIDHAWKFGKEPVTGELEDVAVVGCHLRFQELISEGAQPLESVSLVLLHVAGVSHHIGSKNR